MNSHPPKTSHEASDNASLHDAVACLIWDACFAFGMSRMWGEASALADSEPKGTTLYNRVTICREAARDALVLVGQDHRATIADLRSKLAAVEGDGEEILAGLPAIMAARDAAAAERDALAEMAGEAMADGIAWYDLAKAINDTNGRLRAERDAADSRAREAGARADELRDALDDARASLNGIALLASEADIMGRAVRAAERADRILASTRQALETHNG